MKPEYFALGFVVIATGVGGFYYMDSQLDAQISGHPAGGEFLESVEMTGLMEKVRLGLLVTTLAGVGIAGFGATGRRKPYSKAAPEDLKIEDIVFCRHCGMPGNASGYCSGCGQGRQVSSSVFRRCAHCGRSAGDDSAFCTSCGWKF
ncbi:zinc ribbon domain-containing protein [Nitrososphaera sp.]|uniref:zinc ribbon domain-containing protein n=1 Tax=Nitrososphaera sp. TaxID=1971748 RepID=UPI003176B5D8